MKRNALIFAAAIVCAVVGTVAIAQVSLAPIQTITSGTRVAMVPPASAQNQYASMLQLQAYLMSGNSARTGATAPALTSCGGGTPAISGNDYAGTVTAGSSSTGCVITFNTAYPVAPTCVVTSRTAPGTTTPAYTVSTTAITLTFASTSGTIWDYMCMAKSLP